MLQRVSDKSPPILGSSKDKKVNKEIKIKVFDNVSSLNEIVLGLI